MSSGGLFTGVEQHVETSENGRYIRYKSVLGKGAYKTVYKAFDTEEALEVAWNKLHVDRLSEHDLEKVSNEVSLLRQVEHKNIIHFYDTWRGTDSNGNHTINFITEQMMSGTLKEYLRKAKAIKLKVIRRWCSNILEAIAYLHNQDPPIMHRDLKCDNIFINGHVGEVKIGDLGLSGVKEREKADSVIGTPEFMAPELYEESYTEKVDIYAFGMCLLEIVSMEYPYSECNNMAQIFKKVFSGEKPRAFNSLVDGDVKDVIAACLQREAQRPSAIELLRHPLFSEWEKDDGVASNLSLVKGSGESSPVEISTTQSSSAMPIGTELIDWSDPLKRNVLVSMIEGEGGEGDDQQVSVVASNENGGFYIGLEIPIRDAIKRVEFTFDPFEDSAKHIAHEMVSEFGLGHEQLHVIQEEIELQVKLAKQQREAASRNATPQPAPRQQETEVNPPSQSQGNISVVSAVSHHTSSSVPSASHVPPDSRGPPSQTFPPSQTPQELSQPVQPAPPKSSSPTNAPPGEHLAELPMVEPVRDAVDPSVPTNTHSPMNSSIPQPPRAVVVKEEVQQPPSQHSHGIAHHHHVQPSPSQSAEIPINRAPQEAEESTQQYVPQSAPQEMGADVSHPSLHSIEEQPQSAPHVASGIPPSATDLPLSHSEYTADREGIPQAVQHATDLRRSHPGSPLLQGRSAEDAQRSFGGVEASFTDMQQRDRRQPDTSVPADNLGIDQHKMHEQVIETPSMSYTSAQAELHSPPEVAGPTVITTHSSQHGQTDPGDYNAQTHHAAESTVVHQHHQIGQSLPHTSSFVSSKAQSSESVETPSGVLSPDSPQEGQGFSTTSAHLIREVVPQGTALTQVADSPLERSEAITSGAGTETISENISGGTLPRSGSFVHQQVSHSTQEAQRSPDRSRFSTVPESSKAYPATGRSGNSGRGMSLHGGAVESTEIHASPARHIPQSVSDGHLPPPGNVRVIEVPTKTLSTPITPISSGMDLADDHHAASPPAVPIGFQGSDAEAMMQVHRSAPHPDDLFSYPAYHGQASALKPDSIHSSSNGYPASRRRPKSGTMPAIVVVGNEPRNDTASARRPTSSDRPPRNQPDQTDQAMVNRAYVDAVGHEASHSTPSRHILSPERQNPVSFAGSIPNDSVRNGHVSAQQSPLGTSEVRSSSWRSLPSEDSSANITPRGTSMRHMTNPSNQKWYTANLKLMDYCARGMYDEVLTRLTMGATATFADYDRRTPLHVAAAEGHMRVCILLIESGADVSAKDRWGNTPFSDAREGRHIDVQQLLESHGAIDDSSCSMDVTSLELMQFAAKGHLEAVRERIVAGASASFHDYDQRTPLHLACSEGFVEVAEILLVNGASYSVKDRMGRTPVDDALKNGHRGVLRLLCQYGARIPPHLFEGQPEALTQRGMDLIEHAARGRIDILKQFLAHGANPDFRDYDKRTALHLACVEGKHEVVRILLRAGANAHAQDRWGATPMDEARKGGFTAIVEELVQWELHLNSKHASTVSFDHTTLLNGHEAPCLSSVEESNAHFEQLSHGIATSVSMGAIPNIDFSADDFVAEYPSSTSRPTSSVDVSSSSISLPPTPFDRRGLFPAAEKTNEEILLQQAYQARKQQLDEEHRKALEGLQRKRSSESKKSSQGSTDLAPPLLVTESVPFHGEPLAEGNGGRGLQRLPNVNSVSNGPDPVNTDPMHFRVAGPESTVGLNSVNMSPIQVIHPNHFTPHESFQEEGGRKTTSVNSTIRLLVDGLIDAAVSEDNS